MPPLLQPRPLVWLGIRASSSLVLTQVLATPDPKQEAKIQSVLHQVLPPLLLEDVLHCVLQQLAVHHPLCTRHSVISSLLRILGHSNFNKLQLSDLIFAGTVELEALDELECTIIHLLPSFSRLTHLDLSTHGQKVTLPSCSSQVLQAVGYCCPDLMILNLNHNNRVTSEGLLHLYPGEDKTGCLKLEQIFLQDCSVEAADVALLVHSFPALRIVGFRELGTSLEILQAQPRWLRGRRRKRKHQYRLRLTHVDNTLSQSSSGKILDFLIKSCPDVENLKINVCDKDLEQLHNMEQLQHLELRFHTRIHHLIGNTTLTYLTGPGGASLVSLTIFCSRLYASHVATIANNCPNLIKLYLYSNLALTDTHLASHVNNMHKLQVLSLRVGHDELTISPPVCNLLLFLLDAVHNLHELYLLVRCQDMNHNYMKTLLALNFSLSLKVLIVDAPRRTITAPMIEFNIETAHLIMNSCPNLHMLGNLISWNVTSEEVAELQAKKRLCNFHLKIIHKNSNKINDKFTS